MKKCDPLFPKTAHTSHAEIKKEKAETSCMLLFDLLIDSVYPKPSLVPLYSHCIKWIPVFSVRWNMAFRFSMPSNLYDKSN